VLNSIANTGRIRVRIVYCNTESVHIADSDIDLVRIRISILAVYGQYLG
jgi:hypothetical protein